MSTAQTDETSGRTRAESKTNKITPEIVDRPPCLVDGRSGQLMGGAVGRHFRSPASISRTATKVHHFVQPSPTVTNPRPTKEQHRRHLVNDGAKLERERRNDANLSGGKRRVNSEGERRMSCLDFDASQLIRRSPRIDFDCHPSLTTRSLHSGVF